MDLMLKCVSASNVSTGIGKQSLEEMCELLLANGLKCTDEQTIDDILAHAVFEEFEFKDKKVDTPFHKTTLRKWIAIVNQRLGIVSATKSARTSIECDEDGEVAGPESDAEQCEQLKHLGDLLAKCTQKSKTKEIHVVTSKELQKHCGNLGNTPHLMLPPTDSVNAMAKELAKLKNLGIQNPFVKMSLQKFAPEWHTEQCADGFLLAPSALMPTLFRWALAAQATDMVPFSSGMAHADVCMRVAAEARKRGKNTCTAAAYDQIRQKSLAEMCLKGVPDFDAAKSLCEFDREIFEQAIDMAESKTTVSARHGADNKSWKPRSNAYNQGWQGASNWSKPGHTKRNYEQHGKPWENRDSKRARY